VQPVTKSILLYWSALLPANRLVFSPPLPHPLRDCDWFCLHRFLPPIQRTLSSHPHSLHSQPRTFIAESHPLDAESPTHPVLQFAPWGTSKYKVVFPRFRMLRAADLSPTVECVDRLLGGKTRTPPHPPPPTPPPPTPPTPTLFFVLTECERFQIVQPAPITVHQRRRSETR